MSFTDKIRKIDIHSHATAFHAYYPPHRNGLVFVSPEEVLALYDKLNIEKGVLLPLVSPEAQMAPMTSEACKFISDQYPDRFAWFCGIDPRALDFTPHTDLSYLLLHYRALGARGVGELTTPIYADDPHMENLFAACAECDMPILFHMTNGIGGTYGIVDEAGLRRIEKMLKKYPKLKLIGHSQSFWSEISADVTDETRGGYPQGKITDGRLIALLRECENLYCDLSAGSGFNALARDEESGLNFLNHFQDKLMFGCDFCRPGDIGKLAMWLDQKYTEGCIPETVYQKVCRENALRILKID